MVQLIDIVKDYKAGGATVHALRNINLTFRDSEFVSILGPSGCGKTTMLNILGGLDRYSEGDLVINGRSTRDYSDRDWDNYRNRRIGFVFQTYNLITHQSVLNNVELAMTLSGVGKAERRRRATDALERVGLGDQLNKKPNQMSGGQMQRVAIARALVNNPDILMADEPTGALDSETSVQIMEILKEIASDKLVIMVTHNGELADRYSTRIVRLLDGKVISDSDPANADTQPRARSGAKNERKPSMGFLTALSLSMNNLMTKKGRTFLTAFAGSIGIIGIALIMSLSNGMQSYIEKVQEDTLSTYPLQIQEQTADLDAIMGAMADRAGGEERDPNAEKIYSLDIMTDMIGVMGAATAEKNDLRSFKEYIETHSGELDEWVNAIGYTYSNAQLNVYREGADGAAHINPPLFMQSMLGGGAPDESSLQGTMMSNNMMMQNSNIWGEMIDNRELLKKQYDVLAGRWPERYDEILIAVTEDSEITDYGLYCLGLKEQGDLRDTIGKLVAGEKIESQPMEFTYDEILSLTYKLLPNAALYQKSGGLWRDMSGSEDYMRSALEGAIMLTVVGIVRPNADSAIGAGNANALYLPELPKYVIDRTGEYEIVREQLADMESDVFSGKPFGGPGQEPQEFDISQVPEEYRAMMEGMTDEQIAAMMENYASTSSATIEGNLAKLGVVDQSRPSGINIYPRDFGSKDKIVEFIDRYNDEMTQRAAASGEDAQVLHYTDFVGLLMSSVSSIITAISALLMGFVGISLVVSSIMIGIITYVSVLERTKEIGILKAIGASRGDIGGVFNAETMIVGFTAGALGIAVTLLLNIPASLIIDKYAGISNLSRLPLAGGAGLVALSVALTLISGLIPSRIAARKDPVAALRTD
ncbi:MAG: ABC transporter ATP-binding protein/permease [Oscillospiraceae bacterium]|jgi:putative ABC transport system permease protein|nr:ABC transporter ATP-binding protein/permease [Oscillospiraceae bacterium]